MSEGFDDSSSVERLKLVTLFKRLDQKKMNGLNEAEEKLYQELLRKLGKLINPDTPEEGQKRRDLRVPIMSPIKIQSDRDFKKLYLKNISGGGFYIESKTTYAIGTRIRFDLEWKQQDGKTLTLKLAGEVSWVNPKQIGDLQPGMGVRFVDLAPDQQSLLKQMTHELLDRAIEAKEKKK